MEFNDNSKTVRGLLKLGSPVQKLIDSLHGQVLGNLLLISGGSNSGKSVIAVKLLEHFTSKNHICSYFDLENSQTIQGQGFPKLKNENLRYYNPKSIDLNTLISCLKKEVTQAQVKFFFIDYIQLVTDHDNVDILKKLKKFCSDQKLCLGFLLIILRLQNPC